MKLRHQLHFLAPLLACIGTMATFSGCGSSNVPEILRGVTAAGGLFSACPQRPDFEKNRPLALSPELNNRLANRFPPESDEKLLTSALTAEGFKSAGTCDGDPSIKILAFDSEGRCPSCLTAQVYWKADATGQVSWTKGFVLYKFL